MYNKVLKEGSFYMKYVKYAVLFVILVLIGFVSINFYQSSKLDSESKSNDTKTEEKDEIKDTESTVKDNEVKGEDSSNQTSGSTNTKTGNASNNSSTTNSSTTTNSNSSSNTSSNVTNNGTTNIMIITMTDLIDSDEFSMWMGGGMTWELLMQYNSSTPLNSAAASMVTTLGIWTNNTPNAAHALNVDYKAAYSFRINAMASWAVNSYITVGATLPTMQVNTVVSDLSAYELRSQNLFHVVWTHDFDEANNRIDEAMYINGIKVAACYGAGQALGLGHKIVEAYSGQVSLGGRLTAKGGVDYPCQNSSFVDFNIYHGIATETEVADMYTAAIGALAPYEA